MGQKLVAPQGSLRDLRFLLLSSTCASLGLLPRQQWDMYQNPSLYGPNDRTFQPLAEYRAELAVYRTSSTASKRRRGSRNATSRKPSVARTRRSGSSRAKTADSSSR